MNRAFIGNLIAINRSVDSRDKFAAEAVFDKMKKKPTIMRKLFMKYLQLCSKGSEVMSFRHDYLRNWPKVSFEIRRPVWGATQMSGSRTESWVSSSRSWTGKRSSWVGCPMLQGKFWFWNGAKCETLNCQKPFQRYFIHWQVYSRRIFSV